jgi:hypothetical protein
MTPALALYRRAVHHQGEAPALDALPSVIVDSRAGRDAPC